MLVSGYSTRDHLILDLDNTTKTKALKLLEQIIQAFPQVGCCLVLRSSSHNTTWLDYTVDSRPRLCRWLAGYHGVFDSFIGYDECCRIDEILAGLGILNKDYMTIRKWRGDQTLRVSRKNLQTPQPRMVGWIHAPNCSGDHGGTALYWHCLNAF